MANEVRILHMDLRLGDVITFGNGVTIKLQFKKGQVSHLAICAPLNVQVKKTSGGFANAAPSPAN